ncbi:MAG TPA: hypothetical protein VFO10_10725 [Oligoflexus sp.]|uniref:hypothetical protein n=1 Tax=Oligoflexus sp. TaxID=1971216 RepID=UPI002D7FFBAD|nr:hypothetical protein [Oligoflexus sp.]HET9237718.1 hypothetical protein [Oligoflexus sp.]
MQGRFPRGAFIILALAPFLLQCTHGTYKYAGQFYSSDGQLRGSFDAVHVQPHYSNAAGCALTFFAYGGWCWSYLFEPTSGVALSAYEATQAELSAKFGRAIMLSPIPPVLLNWGQGIQPHINYQLTQGKEIAASTKAPATEPAAAAPEPEKPQGTPEYGRINPADNVASRSNLQNQTGVKLLLPFVLGLGLGFEYVSPFKTSVEVGAGIVVGNHRGLFQQVKHPLIQTRYNILKVGAAVAQLQTPKVEEKENPSDKSRYYFYNESSYGLVLELESKDMPSFQFLYFLDKFEYQITPFVLNFVIPLRD